MFALIESWWFLRASDPLSSHYVAVRAKSAFWFREHVDKVLKPVTSDDYSRISCIWSTSWEQRLNEEFVLTRLVPLFDIAHLPLTLCFAHIARRPHSFLTAFAITGLDFEIIFNSSFQNDI